MAKKRLIDANALFDELLKRQYNEQTMGFAHSQYPHFRAILTAQPTVDAVEVVHGRWVEDTVYDMIACTECGHAWNIIDNCTETFNYCPNCGAKMDGDVNG